MKTPDMVKENNFVLREAAKAACDGYFTHLAAGGKGDPAEERWIEALTAGADAITQVVVLESRLAQVERERDAAEHDLHLLADGEGACNVCARFDEGYIPTPPHCRYACDDDCFRWRGICPENTKEE